MPATVRGVQGELRWSYYVAARVTGYTVTRDREEPTSTWSLAATVVDADAYKLAQRPLVFVAPVNQGAFRWPVVSVGPMVAGQACAAVLGPPFP